jgi:hypothetical protein
VTTGAVFNYSAVRLDDGGRGQSPEASFDRCWRSLLIITITLADEPGADRLLAGLRRVSGSSFIHL